MSVKHWARLLLPKCSSVIPDISFLVKRRMTNYMLSHEAKSPGRNLALYVLCHSNKPLTNYTLQR